MPQDNIIGTILGKQKRLLLNRPSNDWVLADTMLGLEIEVERVHHNLLSEHHNRPPKRSLPSDLSLYWQIHRDESLHDYGAEFSFATPMFGEDVSQALQLFLDFQKKEQFKATLRTGIHVHMDARDLSRFQLLGLLAYYMVFEPAIYTWIGDDRDCNNFCVPWYRAEGAVQQAIQILVSFRDYYNDVNKENENALAYCEQFHRYAGLNLQALFKFGSIEFRQLKTTFQLETIRSWINILLSLKRAAQMAPESSMTIISDIKHRGLKQSALDIFGTQFVNAVWAIDPEIEQKIVELSLPNAVELISQVNYASSSNGEALTWFPDRDSAKQGKKPHPWFLLWRKRNFPKDLKPQPEESLEIPKSKFTKKYSIPASGWGGGLQQAHQLFSLAAAQQQGANQANIQFNLADQVAPQKVAQVIPDHPEWVWETFLHFLETGRRPTFIARHQVPACWQGYMVGWGYRYQSSINQHDDGYHYQPQVMGDYYLNNPRPPNMHPDAHDPTFIPLPQIEPAPTPEEDFHNDALDEFLDEINDNQA